MEVSVSQTMGTSVDVGRVVSDAAYGGGLLGALINSRLDKKREIMTAHASATAMEMVVPLAEALRGEDFIGLAMETTRKAMASVEGFDATAVTLVSVPGPSAPDRRLAKDPSSQFGAIRYRYQMSPDFTQLQIIADISIIRSKGHAIILAQRVVSVVQLKHRSYNGAANVAQWSASGAVVAKTAITAAFSRLEKVLPAALNLDPVRYAVVTDKDKTALAFGGGFYGPLLFQDEIGPVVWSKGNGFVAIQAASD